VNFFWRERESVCVCGRDCFWMGELVSGRLLQRQSVCVCGRCSGFFLGDLVLVNSSCVYVRKTETQVESGFG
jgi:hypothetical protein